MQALEKALKAIVQWISFKGRINRTDFWLCYVLPALAVLVIAESLNVPVLRLITALIVVSAIAKRRNDIGVRVSGGKRAGLVSLWVVLSVVALAAAFIAFLGGISGLGDKGMLEMAGILAIIPFLPILLVPLIIGLMPGSRDENEHGPIPCDLSLGKKELSAVATLLLVISVISIGSGALRPSESKLIQAISDDNGQQVRDLLRNGADPNQTTRAGTTALMLAMERPERRQFLTVPLLEYGADPNVASVDESPAQYDMGRSDSEVVDILAKHTPLVRAISKYTGDYAWVVERMIEAGANVNPAPAHYGELSPLVTAVKYSDSKVVEMLIAHGADISAASNQPALMAALEHWNVEKVWLLLADVSDLDQLDSAIDLVNERLKADSNSRSLRTLEQLLKEAVNRELGEEKYPYRQFFSGESQQIDSLATYRQQPFRTPVRVRSQDHVPVRKGPGLEYEKVGKLYAGQELFVTAITNVGKHIVWFKVKDNESHEGYVFGASLCSLGEWYRGLQYSCRFADE